MEERRIDKSTMLSDPDKGIKSKVKHEYKVFCLKFPEKVEKTRMETINKILNSSNMLFGKITFGKTVANVSAVM